MTDLEAMARGHRIILCERALKARKFPDNVTLLAGNVTWWPELAPLTKNERAAVRVGRMPRYL